MVKLPKSYKPTKSEKFMNAKQKEYFRTKLKDWKNDIYKESRETVENHQDSIAPPADMNDRATQESEKGMPKKLQSHSPNRRKTELARLKSQSPLPNLPNQRP